MMGRWGYNDGLKCKRWIEGFADCKEKWISWDFLMCAEKLEEVHEKLTMFTPSLSTISICLQTAVDGYAKRVRHLFSGDGNVGA